MGAPEMIERGLSVAGKINTHDGHDSEYEYEYDAHETEDFYFTLDLSSHDPDADFASHEGQEMLDGPVSVSATPTRNEEDGSGHAATERCSSGINIQILDLPSNNPLVMLGDKTYSCNWSTDLGSQVYVTGSALFEHPQYSGQVIDVVSTSRARLIGRPAKLLKRQQAQPAHLQQPLSARSLSTVSLDPASRSRGPESFHTQSTPAVDQQIARFAAVRAETTIPEHREAASFLERLSIIKQQRGETDLIPFYGVKQYKAPENSREIRERALQADPDAARQIAAYDSRRYRQPSGKKRKSSALQNETPIEETAHQDSVNGGKEAEALPSAREDDDDTTLATEREESNSIDPNLFNQHHQHDVPLDPSLVEEPSTLTNSAHNDQERHENTPTGPTDDVT